MPSTEPVGCIQLLGAISDTAAMLLAFLDARVFARRGSISRDCACRRVVDPWKWLWLVLQLLCLSSDDLDHERWKWLWLVLQPLCLSSDDLDHERWKWQLVRHLSWGVLDRDEWQHV